jgi:hypothetical protein
MLCKKHHTANCAKASLLLRKLALVFVCGCLNLFFTRAQAAQNFNNARGGLLEREAVVYFQKGSATVENGYLGNAASLKRIDSLLTSLRGWQVESISITGHASPEGGLDINRNLAVLRGENLSRYIRNRFPAQAGKIRVLEPQDPEEAPESQYPYLRNVRIVVSYLPAAVLFASAIYPELELLPRPEIDATPAAPVLDTVAVEEPQPEVAPVTLSRSTLFTAKTNLLYDAVTALNVEVEVPVANRFSVLAEDVFPWWETGNKYCFQMWEMGLEARYWFKSWESVSTEKMRGWFAGVYGMSAMYDFQLDRSLDYQGEYWSAGLTGGYVMPIGRRNRVNLEFSLGLGYLQSQYRHYMPTASYDKLIRDRYNDGKASYWGPTKAKVSLIIPINFLTKNKEVRYE